ncbi:Uracil phosphoribosyltransferase [Slackia heliotrinireducens]|uniref:Uracil phosphoribosyltransferase n=1 Tax=Slackia heliotrinireducens (strain ATCC 29202 / DSM 20476 / NCTC 11029 / RHS 1) TaxID=471855 RepID=C7N300_SLAHD|nr:uracil phosphoribosyltransferase [Slackia heliotrinireducens]ACV21521.1 uracil phosphoribosyltransferase [Slackia heliotrinireducens DSM 20476]VEG98987.1 Uracil phosphoribosyltransferase [Slackia heliotrinireducens]
MSEVHVLGHPLIAHKLTQMRDKNTSSADFRRLLKEISLLMSYEVTRDFETKTVAIETPVCPGEFPRLKNDFFTIVPILRAGLGLVDGLLELLPEAHVGHIGLARDERTHEPVEYYYKMPPGVENSLIILVDPMLATGGSAVDAINNLKARGCKNIRMVNLVAAPEGIKVMQEQHPDVDIYVASIDEYLNDAAYIVPGLGDAGDRIFGTI